MSPIPTSLIVAVLVIAWLVVLVPIVARRREHVPESQEDGARFRVLRRASKSLRRRRPFGRDGTEIDEPDDDLDDDAEVTELDEELLDDEDELDADEEFEESDARATRARNAPEMIEEREPVGVGAGAARPAETPARHDPGPRPESRLRSGFRHPDGDNIHPDDDVDTGAAASVRRDRDERFQDAEALDDERYRPVPQRRGRGGFDPEAAEAMRAYKYKRRRRVTLFLLLVTIAFSAAAYYLRPVLWSGTGLFGLLLICYLTYLRRQVRIEENIRQRRLAKMRRARQIRPEYHPAAAFSPRVQQAASSPAGYARGRRVVELDDDDPSFDDLEYYQPIAYRRAAGQ